MNRRSTVVGLSQRMQNFVAPNLGKGYGNAW